MVQREGSVKQ